MAKRRSSEPSTASIPVPVWLPSDPPRPAPFLMTQEEAALLLRIPEPGSNPAYQTLKEYRDAGELRSVRLGRQVRYRLPDVLTFLERRAGQS